MTDMHLPDARCLAFLRTGMRGVRAMLPAVLLACTTTERPPSDSAVAGASGAGATPEGVPSVGAPPAPPASSVWQVRPAGVQGTRDGSGVTARIGSIAADARAALGIAPAPPFAAGSCAFIEPGTLPVRLYLMTVSDTLVRIDIRDSSVTTAEGARIGDTEARIKELYGSAVRTEPHKYTGPTGHYLIVTPAGDATHRIVFETDGQRVTMFRAGRLPEVEWVEGCS